MTTQATPGTAPAGEPTGDPAGTTPAGTPAPGTPAPGTPAAPVAGTPALTPGDGQGTGLTPAQKPAETPSEIEIKLPEGVQLDQKLMDDFKGAAKEWGLNSEQATKAAGFYVAQAQAQEEAFHKMNGEWETALKADKEFGGDNWEKNQAILQRVALELGGEEFVKDITNFRLGNLPSLVRLMWKVRGLVKEDNSQLRGAGSAGNLSHDEILRRDYPSMYNEDGSPKGRM